MSMNKAQQVQLQQAQTKVLTDLLQAPNQLGTQKTLINVNGANSKLNTNKNGIIKYTLENPIKLEIGNRITLVQSFIEERGLAEGTITVDEPIEEEIRFLYYKQGDLGNTQSGVGSGPFNQDVGADVKFASFPSFISDCKKLQNADYGKSNTYFPIEGGLSIETQIYYVQGLNPTSNYINTCQGATTNGQSGEAFSGGGANGAYYYLMEWFNPYETGNSSSFALVDNSIPSAPKSPQEFYQVDKAYPRPLYGQVTINIPAGNYSVSAISNLLNQQLNGNGGYGDQFNRNPLLNKLYHNSDSNGFVTTIPTFEDLFDTYSKADDIDPNVYNPDSLLIGEDTHQPYQRRRGNILTKVYYNSKNTQNQVNMDTCRSKANNPSNFYYADGTTAIGSTIEKRLGATRMLVTDDFNLFQADSPDRVKYRQFQSNFYLAIQGIRALFTNGYYYDSDKTNIDNFETKFFPTLADFFLGNIGDQGLYYLNQDTSQSNYKPDGNPISLYKDGDKESIFRFSCLFPVIAVSQGLDPTKFEEIPNPNTGGTDTFYDYDNFSAIGSGATAQFAGTSSFNLEYDEGDTNRFSISNLHEPYKLPNLSPDGKTPTNFGGQQATLINNPISFLKFQDPDKSIFYRSSQPILCSGNYPIECVSGVSVNNFAFKTVQTTDIFQNLITEIKANNIANARNQMLREKLIFDLFTKPFDQFYSSADAAEKAWDTTLWARLGFSYKQLGNVSENLETVFTPTNSQNYQGSQVPITNPKTAKQLGIISHNAFSFTYIPSTDGMGIGNFFGSGTNGLPQGYGLRSYNAYEDFAGINIDQSGINQNYIHILADSQKLIAENFPALNGGNNYLVIESDIVKENAQDSNSTPTTIVGIVSTENAQNDTIFSQNNYTFTVTESRLLTSIEVRIKNPDGTLVSDDVIGKNNGFVFMLEKAFEPAEMELGSS